MSYKRNDQARSGDSTPAELLDDQPGDWVMTDSPKDGNGRRVRVRSPSMQRIERLTRIMRMHHYGRDTIAESDPTPVDPWPWIAKEPS